MFHSVGITLAGPAHSAHAQLLPALQLNKISHTKYAPVTLKLNHD